MYSKFTTFELYGIYRKHKVYITIQATDETVACIS